MVNLKDFITNSCRFRCVTAYNEAKTALECVKSNQTRSVTGMSVSKETLYKLIADIPHRTWRNWQTL